MHVKDKLSAIHICLCKTEIGLYLKMYYENKNTRSFNIIDNTVHRPESVV
jgi:hypothetical protein